MEWTVWNEKGGAEEEMELSEWCAEAEHRV
jgi:hypothetical protein